MSNEEFYDREIAPTLMALARQCEERGLSFLAVVEWAPGEQGRTATLQANAGLGIKFANAAAKANGNADGLIMALMQHGRDHGHSSICLKQLGVPLGAADQPASV